MMMETKIYRCFSIPLMKFIKENGIQPVFKAVHPVSRKYFWAFVVSDDLSAVLTKWTANKPKEGR
jgi:hypothetical protein